MNTELWVVGRRSAANGKPEYIEVCSSEEKAVAACRRRSHWVAPVFLNAKSHYEVDWGGRYYPLALAATARCRPPVPEP